MADTAQVTVRWLADGQMRSGGISALEEARTHDLVWVDIQGIEEQSLREVASAFDLHPLAIEDVHHFPQRPKIDQYASSWFLAWQTPTYEDHGTIVMTEVDVFLGKGFVITVHAEPLEAIDSAIREGPHVLERGEAGLLHEIVDRLVDSVMPLVDDIADRLEDIEDAMLGNPRKEDVERLYALRRELVALHRVISPERDVLRALVRIPEIVDDEAYRYLQDVGDHLARVEDSIEMAREVAAAVMDIYLSSVSNRMNEIMKQLTVVATIFMPLTLISSIYGMNFPTHTWPPFGSAWGFAAVLGGMFAIALGMAIYFRRKNWW